MKTLDFDKLKKDISVLNEKFERQDLRYNKNCRVRLNQDADGRRVVILISKNIKCCQKIFYSKGCNSYYNYVPKSFYEYIYDNYSQ